MNTCSLFQRKTLVFGFALFMGLSAGFAAFFAGLWAQQAGGRANEPVFAALQGELAFDRSTAFASGQIFVDQGFCVRLKDADVYRGFELELGQAAGQQETQGENANPISVVWYTQLLREPDGARRGIRLLTRAMARRSVLRFALAASGEPDGAQMAQRSGADAVIEAKAFPLCMALYSFGRMQGKAQAVGYTLRFLPKRFGFVQFRLLWNAKNPKSDWKNFRFQIDRQPYELETELEARNVRAKNEVFYSRAYRLALGEHDVQIEDQNTYASARFSIEPGQTKVVDLLLRERLGFLRIVLPQGASLLVDGIPLTNASQGGAAPVWRNVEIQRLEGYQYKLPRLEYRLKLPAGKHHLLLQYEGKTWQRELYVAEGEEQYFELGWQLGSPNAAR